MLLLQKMTSPWRVISSGMDSSGIPGTPAVVTIDTRGANLIVLCVAEQFPDPNGYYGSNPGVIWARAISRDQGGGGVGVGIYYCYNPAVDEFHVFNGRAVIPAGTIGVIALSASGGPGNTVVCGDARQTGTINSNSTGMGPLGLFTAINSLIVGATARTNVSDVAPVYTFSDQSVRKLFSVGPSDVWLGVAGVTHALALGQAWLKLSVGLVEPDWRWTPNAAGAVGMVSFPLP